MKMMKNLIAVVVIAVAIASCSKNDDNVQGTSTAQTVTVASVPAGITSYIEENYPDAGITGVLKYSGSDTAYLVTLETGEFLVFDHDGNRMGHGHPGFINDSTIVAGDSAGHHGGGHHGGGHPGGGICPDSLPDAIVGFITANYPGYTTHHARYDTLCQFGTVMEVMIDSSFDSRMKLLFDTEYSFVAKAQRIDLAAVPEAVTASLATYYSEYTVRSKAELFTLSDNTLQYKLFLHKDGARLSVAFLADGTVICAQ